MKIGVIGGTGKLGAALGGRWIAAGHEVIIGSRDAAAAGAVADKLRARFGGRAAGATNADAAASADIVVVCVPFEAQADRLGEIAPLVHGKIVIDCTVPLVPPRVMRVQLPPEGSAAQRAAAMLGADARVISAFHSVAAHWLATDAKDSADVLVFGDDKAAREVGVGLARDAGLRGLHGGPLANSAAAEAMTSVLIFINKTYRVAEGASIAIVGDLRSPDEA